MEIFSVYVKRMDNIITDIRFISESFSLYACCFSIFWSIYKKVWDALFLLSCSFIIIVLLDMMQFLNNSAAILAIVFIKISFGYYSHTFLGKKLIQQGYHLDDIVVAHDLKEAIIISSSRQK